jgi:hypothetical protein
LTSATVTPATPNSDNASRTLSNLNGLIIAVTNFMGFTPSGFNAFCIRCCLLVGELMPHEAGDIFVSFLGYPTSIEIA